MVENRKVREELAQAGREHVPFDRKDLHFGCTEAIREGRRKRSVASSTFGKNGVL